mgnify:CR=1 FL=1
MTARVNTQQPISTEDIFASHEGGKLSVEPLLPLDSSRALSIAYTPGVAQVSRGTAVLGLGDIGPAASLPVMEGKSALFKAFGGLNSIPLVLDTTDVDEIIETLVRLRPSYGAVNLEDISAPRCFELEQRLIEALDCPVMHDDQHGTAIVVLAALRNAARVTGRTPENLRVVISGAGAAGGRAAEGLALTGLTASSKSSSRASLMIRRGSYWRGSSFRQSTSSISGPTSSRSWSRAPEAIRRSSRIRRASWEAYSGRRSGPSTATARIARTSSS